MTARRPRFMPGEHVRIRWRNGRWRYGWVEAIRPGADRMDVALEDGTVDSWPIDAVETDPANYY